VIAREIKLEGVGLVGQLDLFVRA
jgi:hypothetical protein